MKGYVYFIAPEALLYRPKDDTCVVVKIGFTSAHPKFRLSSLQTGSPVPLDLFAYIDGPQDLEKSFHDAFAEMRSHGEWFFVQGKLRDFLGYLEPMNAKSPRYVERERLVMALYDTVFAPLAPFADCPDPAYLATAEPHHLHRWFPEALEA